MTIKGRKPTPTAKKRAMGNPGKRALPANEPHFNARAPRAERGTPTEVSRFYAEYAQKLVEAGVMTDADHAIFARLAEANWVAEIAAKRLRTEPFTRLDENGIERKSPWIQIWRDATLAAAKLAAEFGMTPSSRTRVAREGKPEKSLAELLFENVEAPQSG